MQTSSVSGDSTGHATTDHQQHMAMDALLYGIVENAEGYMWLIDKDQHYIVFNTQLRNKIKEVTGKDIEAGSDVVDVISLLDASKQLEWEKIYQAGFNGVSQKLTLQLYIKFKPVFFHIVVDPVRDGKKVIALCCFIKEVSEELVNRQKRKNAEEALQQSEFLYKNLFYKSPLPICVCDTASLQFIEVNEAAVQLYGYSRQEFINMTAFDVMSAEEKKELKQLLPTASHVNRPSVLRKHVKKNKEIIFVEVLAHAINYKGSNAWLVLINDITEKIQLQNQLVEEKIRRQQDIAKAVIDAQEKEREALGRELHDNISQMLSTVQLCLVCAKDSPSLQMDMIERSNNTLTNAIEEIRRLSKSMIEAFHKEVGLELSLNNLIENIQLAKNYQITLQFSLPDEQRLDDKLKMTVFRIIQEQLNNIVKHANASVITINVLQQNHLLQVRVEDNGKGFNTSMKRKGIGISNIISRTELFNGRVKIDSSPGNGCRMQVSFNI